jgi:hypothetical protein
MRFFLITFIFLSSLGLETAHAKEEPRFNASEIREAHQVIAFIGQKVFVRRDEQQELDQEILNGKTGETEILISLDSRYEARYKILELVTGDYGQEFINFHVYDHYGLPAFSDYETVLLFVHDKGGELIHDKYNYYPVYRDAIGGWAHCGDPYKTDREDFKKKPLRDIIFEQDVKFDIASRYQNLETFLGAFYEADEVVSPEDLAEIKSEISEANKNIDDFYSPPIFRREGRFAYCQQGVYLEEIMRLELQTNFLPEKRHEICKARLENDQDAVEQFKTELSECIANLKANGQPESLN